MENRPIRQRRRNDLEWARKEERQHLNLENWGARSKYYDQCQRQNEKFEQFTSPRYYRENNELVEHLKNKRDKHAQLEIRREKLNKLLMEEQQTYDIELMMKKCEVKSWTESSRSNNDIPIELLKKVHEGVKNEEETKRREAAEKAIYEKWLRDNPTLRDHQRRRNMDELKMSWLDQQVERRMLKEKEDLEKKKHVAAIEEAIKDQKHEEDLFLKDAEVKKAKLREDLSKQMADMVKQEEALKQLQVEEEEARLKSVRIRDLEREWEENEKQRRTRSIAIENQRYHRQRLQQKADNLLQELEEERHFLKQLEEAELCEKIRNERKQEEIKRCMQDFQRRLCDIKEVEKEKKTHLQSLFDSEAAAISQEFEHAWKTEESLRRKIMLNVLEELKEQINHDLELAKQQQKSLVIERESMMKSIEDQKLEMERLKQWEQDKKNKYRQSLDEQIALKRSRERDLKRIERENHLQELEKLQIEEARLKNEILQLQSNNKIFKSFGRRRIP